MPSSLASPKRLRAAPAKRASGSKYNPISIIGRGALAGLPRRPRPDATRHITPRQVRELVNAEAFAEDLGVAFAVHVTVHWQCAEGFTEADWQKRLTRFLDKLKRWTVRHGSAFAVAWVNENGTMYGAHTHILLHLPHQGRDAHQAVVEALRTWIIQTERMTSDRLDQRGNPWLPVRITGGKFGMRNRSMRAGVCRYLVKSMDPKDVTYTGTGAEPRAAVLNVKPPSRARPLPPGIQRFGASRNLGIAARRAAGWRELTSVEELRNRLNPG